VALRFKFNDVLFLNYYFNKHLCQFWAILEPPPSDTISSKYVTRNLQFRNFSLFSHKSEI